jgi:exodeoxyribonuclease V beta subunit
VKDLDAWKMDLTGTSLIEASAGTGKTYTLTTLYLRLLVEEDLLPSQILVVTYTQAATAELRERVRTRIQNAIDALQSSDASDEAEQLRALATLARTKSAKSGRPDALRRALQEFDEAAIFTIHGFCQRTLQQNAFESGLAFDTELVEKPEPLERTLSHDLWARLLDGEDASFVEWLLAGAGRRWQFEPEALHRNLLGELGADDEMPIVPERVVAEGLDTDTDTDTEGARGRVLASLRAWSKLWVERRTAVADLLLGENDLNRNQFKVATIENKWLPELDRLARSIGEDDAAVAGLAIPECFEKLTTRLLEKGTKKKGAPISDPCFAAFDEVFEAVEELDRALDQRALELRRRFVDEAREQARIRREERHRLFFDDLLSQLRAALQGRGGERLADLLRERYRFALIDEFQDTDPVQYDIFRDVWHETGKATGRRGLVLIGDPKQAIYSFRGADVFTYLSARSDAGDNAYELPINWRSDPELIAAVNTLFEQRTRAFQIDKIEFNPVRPREGHTSPLQLPEGSQAAFRVLMADRVVANDFVDEEVSPKKQMPIRFGRTFLMNAVARDIADLLDARPEIDGRPIDPSDIAILCRRKSELQQARRALEALGIPVVDRGDADVFEAREAWELVCVLRAMMRSGEPATLRGALSTGAHGLGADVLAGLTDEAPELAEISERFAEYGRLWSQSGFGRAFETWRRQEKVTQRLLAYDDGERRLTNWLHLAELLQRVASERSPSRSGLVAWLERAIASEEVRSWVGSDASLLRLERDDHAVSLVTLHRSKGLEYPFVYLPSLWEDTSSRGPSVESAEKGKKRNPPVRFHDEDTGKRTLDLGGGHAAYAPHVEQSKAEGFSEQLRLLYVGLTRAKHQCVVAWGAIGTAYARSPLAWLVDGAASEAEGLDQKASEQKLRKWTDDDWRDAWRRLGEQAGEGAIEVESACFEPRARWHSDTAELEQLAYSAPRRRFDRPVRTTSFSGLIREGHRTTVFLGELDGLGGLDVTGRDLDANVEGAVSDETDRGEGIEIIPDLAADMHEFPRGADAGSLLHEVLEQVDFGRYDEASVKELAVKTLTRNGVDLAHADQVTHVVESVARTPLRHTPAPFRLADVEHGQLRPEVEFTLGTPGNDSAASFSPAGLGSLLASSPKGSPLERYADRASRMDFRVLNGYLRGFIDAVFYDGERYFLVDYKSNHLGSLQADYRPDALIDPMISHDYVLQYLIYSVALDRHLACRLADYDYELHFGGIYYLFLRGLAETHESGCGIFFDRPDFELVRGASHLMGLEGEPRE